MKKFYSIWKAPSANELAKKQLADAKRDLLLALAQREHAVLVAEYQRGLITRLTRMVESGELV